MGIEANRIAALVAEIFPAELLREASVILSDYGVEEHEPERERVRRAIVSLSEGDLDRLRHFVAVAKTDYRDVLFWAETPDA
jgi:hypothetical protein